MGFLKKVGLFIFALSIFVIAVSLLEHLVPTLVDQRPFDPELRNDVEAFTAYMSKKPAFAYIVTALCHGIAALIGGMVLGFGELKRSYLYSFGILATAYGVANYYLFPGQPIWFGLLDSLIYLPGALLGYTWVSEARKVALERAGRLK